MIVSTYSICFILICSYYEALRIKKHFAGLNTNNAYDGLNYNKKNTFLPNSHINSLPYNYNKNNNNNENNYYNPYLAYNKAQVQNNSGYNTQNDHIHYYNSPMLKNNPNTNSFNNNVFPYSTYNYKSITSPLNTGAEAQLRTNLNANNLPNNYHYNNPIKPIIKSNININPYNTNQALASGNYPNNQINNFSNPNANLNRNKSLIHIQSANIIFLQNKIKQKDLINILKSQTDKPIIITGSL